MVSLKFDLPQLDNISRFSLRKLKMRAILAQSSNLDDDSMDLEVKRHRHGHMKKSGRTVRPCL
jgi:hypothetical protein